LPASGVQPVRGPARDALTVFDENAALLQAPDALWNALVAKDWHALFVTQRTLWARYQLGVVWPCLDWKSWWHRAKPSRPMWSGLRTAASALHRRSTHGWPRRCAPTRWRPNRFAHLPVLGVPGWWGANERQTRASTPTPQRVSACRDPQHG